MSEALATAFEAYVLGHEGVVMTELDFLREIFGSSLPASVPAPLGTEDPDEVLHGEGVSRKRGRRCGGEEAGERGGEGTEKEGARERRSWHRGGRRRCGGSWQAGDEKGGGRAWNPWRPYHPPPFPFQDG
jgi:hypothetical protein